MGSAWAPTRAERASGRASLKTADALVAAAEVDIRSNQYSLARTRLRGAIGAYRKAGSERTPDLAAAQRMLGTACMLDTRKPAKDFPEGRRFIRQAVDTYEGHYAEDSNEIIDVYEELLAQIAGSPIEEKLGDKLHAHLAEHRAARAAQ